MSVERRTVLKGGAAAVAALAGGPFQGLLGVAGVGRRSQRAVPRAAADPGRAGRQVRLHLPAGFSYRSFHDTEFPVTLDDGTDASRSP